VTQITVDAAADARPVGFTSTDALLVVMVLVWGVNYIVLKAVMREIEPLAFNAVRFSLAATALAAIARVRGAPVPVRRDVVRLLGLGLLGNTIYQFSFILGLAQTRTGNAALIMAAVPVQTAVISHLRGAERLRARDATGLAISFCGIATVVLGSRAGVAFGGSMRGDLMIWVATVCWSFYIVGMKPLADRYGPVTVTAWTMGLGAVPMVLLSIPAVLAQQWRTVSTPAWVGLFFSAMGALVVAYMIWSRGVQRLGAARTALYSNLTPFVVALAAWAWLGEPPTWWQAAGAVGIFTGIWLTRT
jgi:drug/metabolite transporter (DMT)-like permease